MPEQLKELGLTDQADRNNGIDRRTLLKLPLALVFAELVAACSAKQPATSVARPQEPRIRRERGVWTAEDIRNLGNLMYAESQLNDIAYAGWVLLENLQERPSFSLLSPLFDDEPVSIVTTENLWRRLNAPVPTPAYANVSKVGNPIEVPMRSKTDGSVVRFRGELKIHMDEIGVDRSMLEYSSDLVFKLLIAKEVFNANALGMSMTYSKSVDVDPYYSLLREGEYFERALQVGRLDESVEGVTASFLGDLWAHYLMIPDYLVAVEKRMISPADWGRSVFEQNLEDSFRMPAETFLRKNILFKNSQGVYQWNMNPDVFFRAWMDEALDWTKRLNLI